MMPSDSQSKAATDRSEACDHTHAIVLEEPGALGLRSLPLAAPAADEVVVATRYSGISTGTERLLWQGNMPPFPGMGYPLVPGYESIGEIVDAGADARHRLGERVFVSGANCYGEVRGLFGGSASHLRVDQTKALTIDPGLEEHGTLLALAATALHALYLEEPPLLPDLIVGHGVLGRLLARATIACGGAPTVWEANPARCTDAEYPVVQPTEDDARSYQRVCDVSGDPSVLNQIMPHLAVGGEVVLAGFYAAPVTFDFPPAFMREAKVRIAAQWLPEDLTRANALVTAGELSLAGLITHRATPADAPAAYETAFEDPDCLKMILDWRSRP
ncbi:MAG: chlorophyll synthesis pathway protein BchC [Pseudomonadota bacterium]